jgi:hypothetical protein
MSWQDSWQLMHGDASVNVVGRLVKVPQASAKSLHIPFNQPHVG